MDAEQLLQDVPLFQGLERRELTLLAKLMHPRTFAPGEVVFHEGDDGLAMFIITSGKAEIFHERGGKEEAFRQLGPGEVFGEISVLVQHPRIASVRAVEPTEALVLSAWNFRTALEESPELTRHLLQRLAQWIVDAEDRAAARV
jgi:CRP/FNR family transcriptional regulator, cyclic AMP receptor protein